MLPRVFARPLEIRRGDNVSQQELLDRLNDLGYAQRTQVENPGEFAVNGPLVSVMPRAGTHTGKTSDHQLPARRSRRGAQDARRRRRRSAIGSKSLSVGKQAVPRVTMDAPMLTALIHARVKRRQVPLSALPSRMVQAVLAIEDRRYYSHPGIDPIRMVGALFTNIFGNRPYLEGASTITQQLARNFFLTEEMAVEQQTRQRSLRRKLLEQFMAVILDLRATKDEVLELYLNDVYLGNRGSFAIHGVAEAARLYFGKDVNNLSLGEAATIAGIIQSPGTLSPFNSPDRARERRNVVLWAMADAASCRTDAAERAVKEPLAPVARALDAEAPYFVDFVGQTLAEQFPAVTQTTEAVDVYTTLDLHLQRLAQDAVSSGIAKVDQLLSRRSARTRAAGGAHRGRSADRRYPRDGRRALVQPVAVQPGGQREPAAGIDLQAVRLPGRLRAGRRRRHGAVAGHARERRTDDVRRKRHAVDARRTTRTSTTARSRSAVPSRCRAMPRR